MRHTGPAGEGSGCLIAGTCTVPGVVDGSAAFAGSVTRPGMAMTGAAFAATVSSRMMRGEGAGGGGAVCRAGGGVGRMKYSVAAPPRRSVSNSSRSGGVIRAVGRPHCSGGVKRMPVPGRKRLIFFEYVLMGWEWREGFGFFTMSPACSLKNMVGETGLGHCRGRVTLPLHRPPPAAFRASMPECAAHCSRRGARFEPRSDFVNHNVIIGTSAEKNMVGETGLEPVTSSL